MNKSTLGILVGVLLGLILLNQFTSRKRLATTAGGGYVDVIDSFDRADVGKVRAWVGASADSAIVLEREGDGWTVASAWGWPAKESATTSLFDNLDKLKGEVRSSDEAVLADYQLDDDAGLHLVGENGSGSELFHLIVGKNVRGSNNFVRNAGSNDAYVSNANLRSLFGLWGDNVKAPAQTSWLDMKLLAVEPTEVDRISIVNDGSTISLAKEFAMVEPDSAAAAAGAVPSSDRNNYTWTSSSGGDIAKSKADALLAPFRAFNAADVAHPDSVDAYGLGDGARTVTLSLQDGSERVIRFGDANASDDNRVYVQVEGEKPTQMWKGSVDRIFVEPSSLAPDAE